MLHTIIPINSRDPEHMKQLGVGPQETAARERAVGNSATSASSAANMDGHFALCMQLQLT